MRIAWTGPAADGGGVPGMGMLMLRELLRRGVEVDLYLVADQTGPISVEPMPGLRVIVKRSGWRWDRWYSRTKSLALFTSLAVRALSSVLLSVRLLVEHRRNPYDAVFQLSQTELFLLGRLRRWAPPIIVEPCTHAAGELRWHRAEQDYALRAERRSVHTIIRGWLMFRSRLQPKELASADLVVGLSSRFNELVHQDYGVPREKMRVLRTPVDLERFSPNGSAPATEPRTLLFISRISTRKGVEEIVELSHRLADLAGQVRLLVIGGATLWSDYRPHLDELDPRVAEYVGSVPSNDLPALLSSAAMLLVPSRYEPGSIATAEALACGLPVVLSDEVGNAEVVEGPHVRFHRAGDADGFEAAVRSMLRALDRDEARLRMAARANAVAHFAVSAVISQLIEMIGTTSRPSRSQGAAETARRGGRWLMRGRRRRKVYDALNQQLPRVLGPRIRRGPAAGLMFEGGDTVGYLLGASEPAVQEALRTYLQPGSVFFDVGAHAGFLTILGCSLVGPTGLVHAFEPIAANVEVLRGNLARNGFANATVHELALADVTGELLMAAGKHHITAAIDDDGDTPVRAARCDDLGLPAPTVVKIDVEGAAPAVLGGMRGIVDRHRPVLVIEVHGDERIAVEEFLDELGYGYSVLSYGGMPHLLAKPR